MSGALTITNVSQGGTWYVNCSLLGSASMSRAGGTSASASSGEGGWQIIDRTRQKAATEWLDYYPFVMTCTCMLDFLVTGGSSNWPDSVEGWISTLESFEEPIAGSSPPLPPILTVSGPVPHTDLFWVCSRLDFAGGDDGQIRNSQDQRIQQKFTIELTEYSPSMAITTSQLSPAQLAPNSTILGLGSSAGQTTATPSGTTYTVKPGDTLPSIAASQLGSAQLWPQIAIVNNLSASAVLTPGEVLVMPA